MFFSEHQLDESHALPFRNGVGFIYKVASLSPFACSVRTVAPVPLSALFTGCPCGIGRNPVGKLIRSGLRLFRLNFILITIYVSAVGALGLLQLLSISFPAITTSARTVCGTQFKTKTPLLLVVLRSAASTSTEIGKRCRTPKNRGVISVTFTPATVFAFVTLLIYMDYIHSADFVKRGFGGLITAPTA